jgi:hypothetical protein
LSNSSALTKAVIFASMVGCSIIVVFVLTKGEPSHHYFLLISGETNRCCAPFSAVLHDKTRVGQGNNFPEKNFAGV